MFVLFSCWHWNLKEILFIFAFRKRTFLYSLLYEKPHNRILIFNFSLLELLDIIFRHINAYLFVCSFCVRDLQISNILFYFFSFFYYFIINKLSFDFLSVSSDGDKESERSERIELCVLKSDSFIIIIMIENLLKERILLGYVGAKRFSRG